MLLFDQLLMSFYVWLDGVDILHSVANFGILLAFVPQVVTVHDLYQGWRIEPKRPKAAGREDSVSGRSPAADSRLSRTERFYQGLHHLQARVAKRIVTDASHVAEEVERRLGVDRTRITIIPLGLDATFLRIGTS